MLDDKLCELDQAMEASTQSERCVSRRKTQVVSSHSAKILYNKKVQPPQVDLLEKTPPLTIPNSSSEEPAVDLIKTEIIECTQEFETKG